MIGGGTLVATSLVFARRGRLQGQAGRGEIPGRRARFDDSVKKLENSGKAASALAVVSGLVGLAAGGVGAYLWLRSPSR